MSLLKKSVVFLLLIIFTFFVFSGCKGSLPVLEDELYALDTIISFTVYSDNAEALELAKAEIKRLEALLSVTNPDSDVSRINSNPDTFVKVSDECFELISSAISISENTNGFFDISVYPAVRLWGFTASDYKVPSETELTNVKEFIGYNNIELDSENKSVKIAKGFSLDLGGIAKGYISDKACGVLKEQGISSAILSLGGNIRLVGAKPQEESFKIGIKSPDKEGYFGILKINDTNISTAGGYERYFEENGKRYHHILNPYTASPAETDVLSATVIGEKGEVCDALSTSFFVAGSKGITEISQRYPDYSFIILTQDSVYISSDVSSDFDLSAGYGDFQIKVI